MGIILDVKVKRNADSCYVAATQRLVNKQAFGNLPWQLFKIGKKYNETLVFNPFFNNRLCYQILEIEIAVEHIFRVFKN